MQILLLDGKFETSAKNYYFIGKMINNCNYFNFVSINLTFSKISTGHHQTNGQKPIGHQQTDGSKSSNKKDNSNNKMKYSKIQIENINLLHIS